MQLPICRAIISLATARTGTALVGARIIVNGSPVFWAPTQYFTATPSGTSVTLSGVMPGTNTTLAGATVQVQIQSLNGVAVTNASGSSQAVSGVMLDTIP